MMNRWILLLYFLFSCNIAASTINLNKEERCGGKIVLGNVETIVLMNQNISFEAKVDTGSDMSSLSARKIKIVRRNNSKWVKFVIENQNHEKIIVSRPLIKFTRILKRKDENFNRYAQSSNRPVVILFVKVGKKIFPLQVNLIDRSHFKYPMLLGKDAIEKLNAVVDVSQNHLLSINKS